MDIKIQYFKPLISLKNAIAFIIGFGTICIFSLFFYFIEKKSWGLAGAGFNGIIMGIILFKISAADKKYGLNRENFTKCPRSWC
jgi:hypothetical protein